MWHASTCQQAPGIHRAHLVSAAHRILRGCGDAVAGEWPAWGATPCGSPVYHLRRRLAPGEAALLPHGGQIRDVRGTQEEIERIAAVAAETDIDFDTLQRLA